MSHAQSLAAFLETLESLDGRAVALDALGETTRDAGLFIQAGQAGAPYLGGRARHTLRGSLTLRLPRGGKSAADNRALLQRVAQELAAKTAAGDLPALVGATALAVEAVGEGTLVAAGLHDARYQISLFMTYITD